MYLNKLVVKDVDVCLLGKNQESFISFFKSKDKEEGIVLDEQKIRNLVRELGETLGVSAAPAAKEPALKKERCKEEMAKAREETVTEEVAKAREEANKAKEEIAELKKELAMQKLVKETEKYRAVGKDPAEVAKALLGMDETVRKEYVGVLDDLLSKQEMLNQSSLFTEIGKSGGGAVMNDAVSKIETIAAEIRKSKPEIDLVQAKAQAWIDHPEIVAEYERGGR